MSGPQRIVGAELLPEAVELLGAPMCATPGLCAERFLFAAAEIVGETAPEPEGDGSPFEEGARLWWCGLDEAIAACERGEVADVKTELGLRRLRDHLERVGYFARR